MLIPNRKDSSDSLFYRAIHPRLANTVPFHTRKIGEITVFYAVYAVCYAVKYEKTKKTEKYSDEELKNDLPNDLFLPLDMIRPQLVLDLDH